MAHIDKVVGTKRTVKGSRQCQRLREQGLVPCNVYGHHREPQLLSMNAEIAQALVNSGSKVVDLEVDGAVEKVLVSEAQWDTYSTHVLHIDFLRVDPNERLTVDVPLQTRGIAPGVLAGGILEQPVHMVTIECLAVQLPDFITVRIGNMQLGDALHARDLTDLPEGVTVLTPPDTVLLHVVAPKAEMPAAPAEGVEAPAAEAAPAL